MNCTWCTPFWHRWLDFLERIQTRPLPMRCIRFICFEWSVLPTMSNSSTFLFYRLLNSSSISSSTSSSSCCCCLGPPRPRPRHASIFTKGDKYRDFGDKYRDFMLQACIGPIYTKGDKHRDFRGQAFSIDLCRIVSLDPALPWTSRMKWNRFRESTRHKNSILDEGNESQRTPARSILYFSASLNKQTISYISIP